MDRLRQLEVFVAVAEAGSFAKAARRLALSPPAVTRAVAGLEQRLGTRLFNRTTRSVVLSDAGARLLEQAQRALTELDAAEAQARGDGATPQGHLVVTASVSFGRMILAPLLGGFLAEYPRITLSALLLDRVAGLVEEGIDVGVRIGALPDSSLFARKVGEVRRLLVASPDYVATHGHPAAPADLSAHTVIGFTGLMPNGEIPFVRDGAVRVHRVRPRLEISDAPAAIAAAEAGDGITMSLSYMVARQLREGRLVAVLADRMPPAVPVQIAHPHGRPVPAKTRAFVDFMAPRLRAALAPPRTPP
jgi:DNA-binding transcriptional LysR family regulator